MTRTPIQFIWHFHQPDYRDPWTQRPKLPWVRLHACKGYSDLLTAFQRGEAHWTINWTGTLIEQLLAWNPDDGADTAFYLARKSARELTLEERIQLLTLSFWANHRTLIEPFPRFKSLLNKRGNWQLEANRISVAKSFSHQELRDLQVLFNLAWCGFTLRNSPIVASLVAKGQNYTEEEKQALLSLQAETVMGLLGRYKSAIGDHLEYTVSPLTHPIIPLLIDTDCAGEAIPGETIPKPPYQHPDLAVAQLRAGIDIHRSTWHTDPNGIWFSEGSVSPAAVELAVAEGCRWTVADEGILARSLRREISMSERNRVYRLDTVNGAMAIFFRDRKISDAIGFRYHSWRPETALADLRKRLDAQRNPEALSEVVTVALDGENAWENYDDGGDGFLTQLAQSFVRDTDWYSSTPSQTLPRIETVPLEWLASGSWIDSNFRIWCGDDEKNRAWLQLDRATQLVKTATIGNRNEAMHHLMVAQSSDWFWWYGDINRSENDPEFDRLFRGHLVRIYELANQEIPADLLEPVRHGIEQNASLPAKMLDVMIDGRETGYGEWLGAGEICVESRGAIHRSDAPVTQIRFGYDRTNLFFALEGSFLRNPGRYTIALILQKRDQSSHEFIWSKNLKPTQDFVSKYLDILELSIKGSAFEAVIGDHLQVRLEIREQENIVQRIPEFGYVSFPWLDVCEHGSQYWP